MLTRKEMVSKIAAGGVAIAMMPGLYACTGTTQSQPQVSETNTNASGSGSVSSSASELAANTRESSLSNTRASATGVTASELATPSTTVEYGDYTSMSSLAKSIQNGEQNGTVVEIDGLVTHFSEGASYSIVEPNEDGTSKAGTNFVIDGNDAVYPEDGEHVRIVGKVTLSDDGVYWLIRTLPGYIETV